MLNLESEREKQGEKKGVALIRDTKRLSIELIV